MKHYFSGYHKTNDILKNVITSGSKENIDSYYNVYKIFLCEYLTDEQTFIDCGSAPGGFLKYATEKNMKGNGITLYTGLKLKFDFNIIYGDLLDDEFVASLKFDPVDFINVGAVFYDKTDDKIANSMNQYKLFLNQMYIVKSFLKKNGTFMFVYDIFSTIYNLINVLKIFVDNKCDVTFIPTQPGFKTTQVYILVKNVNFDDNMFYNFYDIIMRRYIPIIKIKQKELNYIFKSRFIDMDSFKTCYYIKYLNNQKELFGTCKLDLLHICTYNIHYISFESSINRFLESKIYNKKLNEYLDKLYKKKEQIRQKFVDRYDITKVNIELYKYLKKTIKYL